MTLEISPKIKDAQEEKTFTKKEHPSQLNCPDSWLKHLSLCLNPKLDPNLS